MRAIRRPVPLLLLLVLLVLPLVSTSLLRATRPADGVRGHTIADPYICVVIKDGNGRPIDTICVPSPFTSRSGGSV
jgi:hypothetical protein